MENTLINALDKFDKVEHFVSTLFEWIALAGILVMMLITVANVVGSKIFLKPVSGSIDIIMLSQLVAVSFGAASALIQGSHVRVLFFIDTFSPRIRDIVDCTIYFFTLVLFILIVWQLSAYGHSLFSGKEVSQTVRIPLYLFAYGAALGSISVCLVLFSSFVKSLSRLIKR